MDRGVFTGGFHDYLVTSWYLLAVPQALQLYRILSHPQLEGLFYSRPAYSWSSRTCVRVNSVTTALIPLGSPGQPHLLLFALKGQKKSHPSSLSLSPVLDVGEQAQAQLVSILSTHQHIWPTTTPSLVVLKTWCPDQQHQHHLGGTC